MRYAKLLDQLRQIVQPQPMALDPLTGVFTRQGLLHCYEQLPEGTTAALLMIDLNGLKRLNDFNGHGAGDQQLVAVAQTLEKALPPEGVLARWGGDEFVVLLPHHDETEALEIAAIALQDLEESRPGTPAFSVGVAPITSREPFERALALADSRMYEDKERQRDVSFSFTNPASTGTLAEFTAQLEWLENPTEIVAVGLTMVRDRLGYDAAIYLTPDAHGPHQGLFTVSRINTRSSVNAIGMIGLPFFQPGQNAFENAMSEGRTIWGADYSDEKGALTGWCALGLKTYLLVPVRDGGRLVGMLGVLSFESWQAVTSKMRLTLESVALRVGHTLERVRVDAEVRRTLENGLSALGLALETRELEPKGHTERVVRLAESLGNVLGLRGRSLDELRQGAYLHDIGKLAIPDAVLQKPSALDPDEWGLMQSHASVGSQMASRIPNLSQGALNVIRHHHERWDGMGYPDHLAGETIPLVARIFAVCDVYDTLLSKRAYSKPWSVHAALEEIRTQSGKQFDPKVIDAFLGMAIGAAVARSGE